ncbi:MAG: hypothetical protein ABW110_13390 [Steroidobacteraceae bacterium]
MDEGPLTVAREEDFTALPRLDASGALGRVLGEAGFLLTAVFLVAAGRIGARDFRVAIYHLRALPEEVGPLQRLLLGGVPVVSNR